MMRIILIADVVVLDTTSELIHIRYFELPS